MEYSEIVEYRVDESRIATVISADFGMASDIDACLLSRTERIRASQIPSDIRRSRFIFGRVFLRSAVGHILGTEPYRGDFVMGQFGKPYLPASHPPWFFSLSHTRHEIVAAFVKGEAIGIDIEQTGRDITPRLREFVFRPEEIRCISLDEEDRSAFLHGWVCKEAVLKCIGSGLSRDPKAIGLDLSNGRQPSFMACDYSSIRPSRREFRLVRLTHLQNTIGVIALRERPLRDRATHRILKKGELKMKIGIIGAGAMARALCKLAIHAGHEVMLSNSRGKDSLIAIAEATACLAGTANEAAEFGEVVIIAVPLSAYRSIPSEPLQGKIVLDLLNYFPHRDGNIPELQREEITTSELLARHLPGTRVVKAFNSITVDDLTTDARPVGAGKRRALPIAGDDQEAKIIASRLIDELGFDIVDGGCLADSWRFERFRPVYCVALDKETLKTRLASTARESKVPDGYWLHNRQVLL